MANARARATLYEARRSDVSLTVSRNRVVAGFSTLAEKRRLGRFSLEEADRASSLDAAQ